MNQNDPVLSLRWAIAIGLKKTMEENNLTKTEMAKKLNTSRSALDRMLDPQGSSYNDMSLSTASRVAQAIGAKIEFKFQRKPS